MLKSFEMSERPKRVLAIDGGNSKTDVALVAADGTLLATARGPGSNAQNVGLDQAMAVLADLVAAAARQAGLPGNLAARPAGARRARTARSTRDIRARHAPSATARGACRSGAA